MLNQGYQQAMQQAQQAFEAQQGRQMQGAQLTGQLGQGIGSLGAQVQGLGQQDVTFQYGLGQQQQAQQQREIDALRASQLQSAYQPYQQLAFLSDIYKGAPSTQMAMTTQSAPTPSPFQQVAGLATGLVGTAAGFKQMEKTMGGLF
jgi:mannose/fructose-specific phosphotransferase system component IIA